jgi:hypothetical protein
MRGLSRHRRRSHSRTDRPGPRPRSGTRCGRRHNGIEHGDGPTGRSATTGVGGNRAARPAGGSGLRRTRPSGAAVHRRTRCRRRDGSGPARLPALSAGEGTAEIVGRQANLPHVLRSPRRRSLHPLRSGARTRGARRYGKSAVPQLPDQGPGQPRGMSYLPGVQAGRGAAGRRSPQPKMWAPGVRRVRHLRQDRHLRHLPRHRPTLVPTLSTEMGHLRRLWRRRPGSGRNTPRSALRPVREPRSGLLGALPELQNDVAAQSKSMPAMHS